MPHVCIETQHFPIAIFLVMSMVNILVSVTGIVSRSIIWIARFAIREHVVHTHSSCDNTSLAESIDQAITDAVKKHIGSEPLGNVIGIVERQLYLYAAFSGMHAIISGIIVFKAFSGWITRDGKMSDKEVLAQFYVYAIGNFISIGWALAIYEFGRSFLN